MNRLQEKIRKCKNPSVLELALAYEDLPSHLQAENMQALSYGHFCRELLNELKGIVPAVRVSFSSFAFLGSDGWGEMIKTLEYAKDEGYYVLLDAPEILSPAAAERTAKMLMKLPCDGMVISGFLGSDIVKPFLMICKQEQKDIFVVARTGNRSASELQDLLAGSRQVYLAAADYVNRYAGDLVEKCSYSQVAVMAGASSADSLRTIRSKYPRLFILIDCYDYPNANAKNCAAAFDKFGHGAAACGGEAILKAWKETESDGTDYLVHAKAAALRMKKNLTRYVTIL